MLSACWEPAPFDANAIISSETTRTLIEERGKEDWDSEFGRMPRLFKDPDSIPGLTWPDITFDSALNIELAGDRGRIELKFCGRGHTAGDIVAWHDKTRTLFAGDLVEAQAALYTGDAFHMEWVQGTLNNVKAFRAQHLIGGRGPVARGEAACDAAIEQTREFLHGMVEHVGAAHRRGGTLKEAFLATHAALAPKFGRWPIFEHCLPFNVQRLWDQFDGIDWPRFWTMERDREVWAMLQDYGRR
jgi:hypothetical protein